MAFSPAHERAPLTWSNIQAACNMTVIVAALGYFVDLFDIALYAAVRVESLSALGYTSEDEIFSHGIAIYNWGMVGMIIGGFLWGVLADKFGRLKVLFGSILLYSLGTLANAFVWDVNSYIICRFITSIGLAGELGAAITLVAESLPPRLRGIGTSIVAAVGLSGSAFAVLVGGLFRWQTSYIIGGVMGLLLLAGRFKMMESIMFQTQARTLDGVSRGNLKMLFASSRLPRYLRCVLIGTPIYFITGVLFTFSPELSSTLGLSGVNAGPAVLLGTIGLSVGDLWAGVLSQMLSSRKKAIAVSLGLSFASMVVYLTVHGIHPYVVYLLCFTLGVSAGFWAVLVTVAAEQFGTNLRATVATTVPNLVRGSAVIATIAFSILKNYVSLSQAALIVGLTCVGISFLALVMMEETFGKDLNFLELHGGETPAAPTAINQKQATYGLEAVNDGGAAASVYRSKDNS